MIVDSLRSERSDGGTVERSARLRWSGGELRLFVRVSELDAVRTGDASAFLAAALLPAMRRHEDLEVEGAVSPQLLERVDEIQSFYHGWDRSLRRCDVRAEPSTPSVAASPRHTGAFFSRGVDSTYSAVVDRAEPIDRLVFAVDLEPIHSSRRRCHEIELAGEAAAALGIPLLTVSSNVRELTDPILDWSDSLAAGLSFLALSLEGGFRRMIIPSWSDYESLGAAGSHPLLDRLFSTESVEVVHDAIVHGRLEKVGVLVRDRPDVLRRLKVCSHVDDPGNCGRCTKCLWTMCCLQVHGALEQATSFPPEIDLDAVARQRLGARVQRIFWLQVLRALAPEDPLRAAIGSALRRSAHPTSRQRVRARLRPKERVDPPWDGGDSAFRRHETNRAVSVLRDGKPYP